MVRALLDHIRENGRVCPVPRRWNELWEMLPARRRGGRGWEPPLPLILAAWWSVSISGKNHRATGEGAGEFRGTATKSLENFGAPRSRLEIPEWFGRPYLRPYSMVAL